MCEDDAGEVYAGTAHTETTTGGSFCDISAVGSVVVPTAWAENDERELVALTSGHGDVDGTLAEIEVPLYDYYNNTAYEAFKCEAGRCSYLY